MNPNQETRAYIVHLTDDARHSLSAYDFTFTPRDTFKEAQLLDTDALRLVLEAAKWAQSEVCNGNDPEDGSLDPEDLTQWQKTKAAISKLSALI